MLLTAEAMILLDATIVQVAGPAIHTALPGPAADIPWFSAAYTLPFAAFLITGGRLGDVLGRAKVFKIGVAGFVLASLACAIAPDASVLIGARAVQGAAAALVIPQTIGLIRALFEGDELAKALGTIGPVMGLSAVTGPLLGGFLTQAASWRAVFLVNVPLGLAMLLAAGCCARIGPPPTRSTQPERSHVQLDPPPDRGSTRSAPQVWVKIGRPPARGSTRSVRGCAGNGLLSARGSIRPVRGYARKIPLPAWGSIRSVRGCVRNGLLSARGSIRPVRGYARKIPLPAWGSIQSVRGCAGNGLLPARGSTRPARGCVRNSLLPARGSTHPARGCARNSPLPAHSSTRPTWRGRAKTEPPLARGSTWSAPRSSSPA
ncbi:MFS transporter [Amycolatopsis sp. cmx-4-83]|uniref:MFS transporter n=1 Tax=Amycolatopsis sp. cmx-4-83 TaxID=2790940 RepID=UPI00397D1709